MKEQSDKNKKKKEQVTVRSRILELCGMRGK